ncbi:MAG: DNRLRE domain-containing protein, partial [Armatimonadota bacterium]|nr:DNRLRE domain-containing protein [Armatimonadota bacterium]
DWPCFSKYYITFPLDSIPQGKTIMRARLTLYHFGNSGGPGEARPSWIQVLIASADWREDAITWNNAPLAYENVGGSWVEPLAQHPGWPGVPRTWDVSYAVARAYSRREPLRLVLYSADSAYHSGKYFVSCNTGDWNTEGRPKLEVWWVD